MKVKIIRPTVAQKRAVFVGDVLEVSKEEAVQLIGANKAVAVKESAVETAAAPVAETAEAPVDPTPAPVQADAPKPRKSKKASD